MARKKRVSWLTSQREKLHKFRQDKAERKEKEFQQKLQDNPPSSGSRYQTSRSSLRASVYQNPRANWNFREWVDELFEEGYDLSEYTWEGLYETYVNEEASHILENYSIDAIYSLLEAKSIRQEVALAIANRLPKSRKFDSLSKQLRMYAVKQNIRRIDNIDKKTQKAQSAPQNEAYEAIVRYLFVEGYTDTIEAAELMAESISDSWAHEILEEADIFKTHPRAHKFPLTPSELRSAGNIGLAARGIYPEDQPQRSAKRIEPKRKPRKLEFEVR